MFGCCLRITSESQLVVSFCQFSNSRNTQISQHCDVLLFVSHARELNECGWEDVRE